MAPINDLNTEQRVAFWAFMLDRHPQEWAYANPNKEGMRWHWLDHDLVVSLAIGINFVRVFIRGVENADPHAVAALLEPFLATLPQALGAAFASKGEADRFFSNRLDVDMTDGANWAAAADFLWGIGQRYEGVLAQVMKDD